VGYEEDAGTRVYRRYDSIRKRVILSRDVIIDEISIISDAGLVSDTTTTKWEKEASATVPEVREENLEDFQPLDAIVPPIEPIVEPTGIQDAVTVHPALAAQSSRPNQQHTVPAIAKRADTQPRGSQRTRLPSGLFDCQAQFALVAGLGEEPQTLTEALSSEDSVQWRAARESELTSLSQNNTWVIEPLP